MRVLLTDLRIALASLKATRLHTLLTTLGIVIGVACITTVIALGDGARSAIGSQLSELGNDVITVRPGKAERDANGNVTNYNIFSAIGATTLTERDYNSLSRLPNTKTAPLMLINGSVAAGGVTASGSQIIASNGALADVLNLKMSDGDFLNPDIQDDNTVVIGTTLADRLFNTRSALGRTLQLRGKEFTVVGIIKETKSTTLSGYDLNSAAFVQLDTGKSFNQGIAQIQQMYIKSTNQTPPKDLQKSVTRTLLTNHGGEEDFAALTPSDTQRIADGSLGFLTGIISAIASISILVGGIGIMNIMLVSVSERTREIGIRKSIGASNRQILRQFLIEALVMTVTGGVIGILIAAGVSFLIAIQFGFFPLLSLTTILLALGISIGVGVIFGSWPALRAARKDPIDALRQPQ